MMSLFKVFVDHWLCTTKLLHKGNFGFWEKKHLEMEFRQEMKVYMVGSSDVDQGLSRQKDFLIFFFHSSINITVMAKLIR